MTYPILPEKITHVLFDMDGTCFDTEILFQRSLVEGAGPGMNIDFTPDDYKKIMGYNKVDTLEAAQRGFGISAEDAERMYLLMLEWLDEEMEKNGLPPRKGLVEFLDWMNDNNIPYTIASGSERYMIERNLRLSGLGHYFDQKKIIDGDQVEIGKPDPTIFQMAAKAIGCTNPRNCIVFEDSENGIMAARNGGFPCILIPELVDPSEGNEDCFFGKIDSFTNIVSLLEKYL